MTLGDINSKITFLTGADTTATGFATADRVISINNYYNRIVTMILKSQDEWDYDDKNNTDFPIMTTSLVANQPDYALPTNVLKIKRVEVTFDGSNWYRAESIDDNERSADSTQTTINNLFQTARPYYDIQFGSIFLFPIPTANVSGGLKVWVSRQITEITSSDLTTGTYVPGFDPNFHMVLAYGAAYEFGLANGKENTNIIKNELEQMMAELQIYYGDKDKDRTIFLKPNPVIYT